MQEGLIPKGVAHVPMTDAYEPEHVVFVLLPDTSMLAFSAAIETLRIANQLTGKLLYRWQVMSEDGAPVRCSNGIEINVDSGLTETKSGSMVFVCSGTQPEKASSQKVADWTRLQWRLGRTVGGLCTGAYTLARAGILKGRSFTLHWENILPFKETYPDLEPSEQLYVVDDRIMTCGGGAAATDLFLKLIYERFGPILSEAVLNMCLHFVHRAEQDNQQSSKSASLGTRNEKLIQIINLFDENLDENLRLDEVAKSVGVSRRQMERLFGRHIGKTPKQYLMDLRLQRARALLAETDISVSEAAVACGFEAVSHFSKRFRERFGMSPYAFSIGRS
jgi:transcriptional regulator GlxA family with amidase domain